MLLASATGIGLAQQNDIDKPSFAFLPLQVSTVPSNGDTTPYGLAFVPKSFPMAPLFRQVSFWFRISTMPRLPARNYNRHADPRSGKTRLFFQGNSPIGFTLALTVARAGLVFAGSLPTSGGTAEPGPLDIFDAKGHLLTQVVTAIWLQDRGEWH